MTSDSSTSPPTAVGAYIFAGGFTVGVKRAGFDVLAHLEGNGYGASSARLNWPELPIHYPVSAWPLETLARRRVDLVYANPPCAIFSSMGIVTTRGRGAWKSDPRTSCWHDCFSLLGALAPGALAIESVTQAYTTGRELIDELTLKARDRGYSVTHLLLDAKWLGLPQSRKRFFFVAHRAPRFVGYQLNWAPPPTVRDALAGVTDPGRVHEADANFKRVDLRLVPPGGRLRNEWERQHPEETWQRKENGHVRGRPSFSKFRLHLDRQFGAFTGDNFVHPVEHRRLGVQEMKALCGYPADFELDPSDRNPGGLLARAVMPPVAAWLARALRETISHGGRHADGATTVTLLDLRRPNVPARDLTAEYAR